MVRQQTRRRFLRAGGAAVTASLAGCSGSADEDTAEAVSYDFDESRGALTEAGWKIGPSVDISDSHLRGTDRENRQNDYAMYPSPADGTWTFGGVANDAEFYGIQFILSTAAVGATDVDGDDLVTAEGYSLLVRQKRYGGLVFRKLSSDGDSATATSLHEAAFESSGSPNEYAVSMPDSNRFRLSVNGTELATVTDDTFDINSLVVRFDATGQRVDSVAYSP